jgi:hypothetical protein
MSRQPRPAANQMARPRHPVFQPQSMGMLLAVAFVCLSVFSWGGHASQGDQWGTIGLR